VSADSEVFFNKGIAFKSAIGGSTITMYWYERYEAEGIRT